MGSRRGGGEAPLRWDAWWEVNDDPLLVKAALEHGDRDGTASSGFFGRAVRVRSTIETLNAEVRMAIRQALLAALEADDAELVDSAAIALARTATPEEALELFAPLVATLRHPQPTAREAATLALGILRHGGALPVLRDLMLHTEAGRRRNGQDGRVEPLVRAFAAAAVALGITGSSAAAPELRKRLRAETTTAVRCQVALALALTGAADAAEELRPLLVAKGVDPQLRWHAARGLGVLRDREAAPLLISTLRESTTLIEVVAAASALGQLRDRTAVQPLLDLVSDRRQAPARRGFAIVALGMLGDSDRLPWNSVFTVGSNWLADGPALAEIRDLL